jgi:hypothetical protein
MVISGEWLTCDDGIERPVIRGEAQARDGSWVQVWFLLDTGADCTVLGGDILGLLDLPTDTGKLRIGGLGGRARSVVVETRLRFLRDQGGDVTFRGEFAAVPDPEALDMSVLGRDISGRFGLLVDRPADIVCLASQRHRCVIVEA